jgi:O-acetyl-ADP-ribose deacetylase (regulator of RNase III)
MHIIFFDKSDELIQTYKKILGSYNGKIKLSFIVSDVETFLNDYKVDAIISPANSFGDMTGGIDSVYSKMDKHIETNVKNAIKNLKIVGCYGSYLPVGKNIIVKFDHKNCPRSGEAGVRTPSNDGPYLICAPTMFIPGNIKGTNNIYTMMCGLLINKFDMIIACPGLGTGIGKMSFEESAYNILKALNDCDA